MHEMSIAQSVLDIAVREMEKNAARGVAKIKISIGQLSGVAKEALEFAFDVLKPETPARSADIEIEVVELRAECGECGVKTLGMNDLNLLCRQCGGTMRITAGREMKIDYLDLD